MYRQVNIQKHHLSLYHDYQTFTGVSLVACSAVPDTTAIMLPGYSTPIARQHSAVSHVLLTEAAGFDDVLRAAIPVASAHHLLRIFELDAKVVFDEYVQMRMPEQD